MFVNNGLRPNAGLVLGGGLFLSLIPLSLITILSAISLDGNQTSHPLIDRRITGGSLVIAGGGSVSSETRERFIELAGGPNARIVVIPATDPEPGKEDCWLSPWRNRGVRDIQICNACDKVTANTPKFYAALSRATGVWFSGGYQDLLAERYVDTAVQKCLHDVLRRNGVVGGCSAGASILSRVMIKEGEVTPVEATGLDILPNAIVDQHFLQRNRLWRMQQMLETHPDMVGLGIDEDTALVIELDSGRLNVIGDSYALVCVPASGPHPGRIEVLKSGDHAQLSQLRKNHLAYQAPWEQKKHS